MQTLSATEEVEENEEQMTAGAPLTPGAWLEEVEKEKLERELEDRNAEIRKLKEALRKTESAAEQVGVTNRAFTHAMC